MEAAYKTETLEQASKQAHMYTNVFKPAVEGFFRSQGTDFTFMPKAGNMVLAGITANGITAQIGYGWLSPLNKVLPFQISHVLFDRETGKIRYIAPGVEESVSVMAQAPNGNLYMSNSPIRRLLNIGILRAVGVQAENDALKYFGMDMLGGIAKYTQQADRKIRLAEESAKVLVSRMMNLLDKMGGMSAEAISAEISRFEVPTDQFEMGIIQAHENGEIDETELVEGQIVHALAATTDVAELPAAIDALQAWLLR
jgi:hypothetical protein